MPRLPTTLSAPYALRLLLAAAFAAGMAHAQVTPSEPFGGRPFGSPPGTPSVQQQRQQELLQLQQQQQQNAMGAAPPVVQAPPSAAPPSQPAAAPQPSIGASVGPAAAMQTSRTTGQPVGQAPQAQAAPAPAAQPVNPPAPATMAPPFARNAPAGGVPAAAASAAGAQPPVRGLPADAPRLVVTGSVYSPDPAKRLLIVNGQVFREGADLGQGVVLEQVHKESAVLGFRGTKYNVMF